MSRIAPLALAALLAAGVPGSAADVPPNKQYQSFVLKQAAEFRKGDRAPATRAAWEQHDADLRKKLFAAWGGEACFLPTPCDLDPRPHGAPLKRDGYTVEKLTIQTRPGVRMTCNLYVPNGAKTKPAPAILQVHGHWKGAKQDPTVQARCIGAAKLGFVVLCVDAFGAGERGVGTALGEYHGDMTAATLLPLGLPLSGLQVYENMRAVDYLETRPEVDKARIGLTGASGGGNQTMYAGAWDRRFKCVVPVCSVGNYQAYLQAACCMCEVVPGALAFTEEWAVLALTAPRPLMVVNATKDAFQFSVGEAQKSLALTAPVYKLFGKPDHLRHAVFDGPHDYSKPMREAMYGFMTLHLKGEGAGDPIPEPKFTTEPPEDLRCYPGDTRPKDFVTLPKFAAREAKKLLDGRAVPGTAAEWAQQAARLRPVLVEKVLGGFPDVKPERTWTEGFEDLTLYDFRPEPGLSSLLRFQFDAQAPRPKPATIIILSFEGGAAQERVKLETAALAAGLSPVTFDLRATGSQAVASDKVGRAPDHNTAEWGLWLGRPLLGQWVFDVRQYLNSLSPAKAKNGTPIARDVILVGEGAAGLVALCAAATDDRVTKVAAVNTLTSFVTDEPYTNQRLGTLAPGVLRDVGDVGHLAALCAGKRVVIAGGTSASGRPLAPGALATAYAPAAQAFKLIGKEREFAITTPEGAMKELGLTPTAKEPKSQDEPIFEPGAKLAKLAGDGAAGEGPAWDPQYGTLTSGAKGIHQYTNDGATRLWRKDAGTNGLLFDRDGNLVCCEPVSRSVARIDRKNNRTVLTDAFGGKKYNQPNDLTIDSKNRIYFSDPRYGPRDDMQQKDDAGRTIEGVYRIDPDGGVSRVIGREVNRANGVLVSADDKFLFVADNNNDVGGARKLWRFALNADGTVDPKSQKLLYDWGTGRGPDGIKQDAKGRLYVAGGLNKPNPPAEPDEKVKGGIYVIDPESGKLLAFVSVPTDEVTNCAFGGEDLKTLFITGGGTLYSIRTTTPGRVIWPKK